MVKELTDIIDKIKENTGKTMQQISVEAGYTPNYLSEQISKNKVSAKLLAKINLY